MVNLCAERITMHNCKKQLITDNAVDSNEMTAWKRLTFVILNRGWAYCSCGFLECHPFLMHDFSSGGLTSLSHCCSLQFLVRVYDEYSLIHSSSIDPALPLPQTTSLISWSQHSMGRNEDNGSKFCLFTESEALKISVLSVSGSQCSEPNPVFWESGMGISIFNRFQVILICIRLRTTVID